MQQPEQQQIDWPFWFKPFLGATMVYHLIWGCYFIWNPASIWPWIGWEGNGPDILIQALGGGLLVLALGYGAAGRWPLQHWGFVCLGLTLKAGAATGSIMLLIQAKLPTGFWVFTLANDVAWLPAFLVLLYVVYRRHPGHKVLAEPENAPLPAESTDFVDQHGRSLEGLQLQQPVLLVFLRHFGCTFCRETMADLAREQAALYAEGVLAVVVHQSPPERADAFFASYDLPDMARISDPERALYQAFALHRGTVSQMFGWKSWVRGLRAGAWDGHWVGKEEGDGWQMPGVFLLHKGQILRSFRHQTAADRPDYQEIACELPMGQVAIS